MDLDKWLEQAGLDRLAPPLRAAGIDLDVLLDLDVTDLAEIGLNLGDRKRLLKAIEASSQTLGATSVAVADIDRTATEPAAAAELTIITPPEDLENDDSGDYMKLMSPAQLEKLYAEHDAEVATLMAAAPDEPLVGDASLVDPLTGEKVSIDLVAF